MTTGGQSVLGAKVRIPRIKALARERLDELLTSVWDHRLALVVAPAGSGKTTLLAQFAAASGVPVAWYRAEPADASAEAAVAHLERGLVSALGLPGGWKTVDDAIEALDGWRGERALVAVDDLHALWGTEAEATLERLLSHLPPGVVMVAATRRAPGFNLSRLRVSGELFEIGPEELRFRSWEVERLFLEFYDAPTASGRAGRAGPSHRGMGGRAAAVPPGDAGQAGDGAAADAARARDALAAGAGVPRPQRARRAAAARARLPPPDVRPRSPQRVAVRRAPGGDLVGHAAGGARAATDLHRAARRRRRLPLPRGPAFVPRGGARRVGGRGRGPGALPRGGRAARAPRPPARGAACLLPRRGLAGGDQAPRRTGGAGHRPSGRVARGAAAHVAGPRSVAAAGIGAAGRRRGAVGGGARRLPTGRGGVGSGATRRRQPTGASGARGLVRPGRVGAHRLDRHPPVGGRQGSARRRAARGVEALGRGGRAGRRVGAAARRTGRRRGGLALGRGDAAGRVAGGDDRRRHRCRALPGAGGGARRRRAVGVVRGRRRGRAAVARRVYAPRGLTARRRQR